MGSLLFQRHGKRDQKIKKSTSELISWANIRTLINKRFLFAFQTQCGNLRIFLKGRFSVKLILMIRIKNSENWKILKMAVFKIQNWLNQNWFHVKSKWLKNSSISTLCKNFYSIKTTELPTTKAWLFGYLYRKCKPISGPSYFRFEHKTKY